MVSDEQFETLIQKITSARCIQLERVDSMRNIHSHKGVARKYGRRDTS